MISAYKFIQKFWLLHNKILKIKNKELEIEENNNFEKFTNQMIDKLQKNLENFHYNVIIANIHEIYNFISKIIDKNIEINNLKKNYIKILKSIFPVMPHFASECLYQLGEDRVMKWPEINKQFLNNKINNIVVQVNGKKRDVMTLDSDVKEADLINKIKNNEKLKNFVNGKKIKKTIYVQNKLINLII
jgi:leucyl-tRNA synthetase